MDLRVVDNGKFKFVRSEHYNYNFDYKTGYFERWGKTKEDDPQVAPTSEILDVEISSKCSGPGGKLCKFCYKSNTPDGKNMSFETFKDIIDKMKLTNDNPGIMQLAIGADSSCTANPEVWKMMDYCVENKVIPNITVADISDETADNLIGKWIVNPQLDSIVDTDTILSHKPDTLFIKRVGAVAVSRYEDKNYCYDSIQKLVSRGLNQCNIHQLICKETLDQAYETLEDYNTDERLKGMKAIVFLSLKQKGRGVSHSPLSQEEFKALVDRAFELNVPIGFDSCGCHSFIESIKGRDNEKELTECAEPCESTCMSIYISVDAEVFPCSFCEQVDGWDKGIDMKDCNDFVKDVWMNPRIKEFRKTLLENGRKCPIYNVNGG